MSSSAKEDVVDDTKVDELEEAAVEAETGHRSPAHRHTRQAQARASAGQQEQEDPRCPGCGDSRRSLYGAGTSSEPPVKRGRGRPPKRKPEETADAEPQPKRKRGRPPKAKPAPPPEEASGDDAAEEEGGDEEPVEKKKKTKTRKDAS
ncbi:hypothetical protein BC629DRAFT_1590003 [Irpex lacteus]|nr:hypothetical protein BC629DRAFT_1590003 [Irpex lacteus]